MKTFKQYFTEAEASQIYAVTADGDTKQLGDVEPDQLAQIVRYIDSLHKGGNNLIEKLIADSKFDSSKSGGVKGNDYLSMFRALMADPAYEIDWSAFKNHVETRFERGDLSDDIPGTHGQWNLYTKYIPIIKTFIKTNEDQFFENLFTMSFPIGGTSVGDGEFLLGIIGNGVKGDVGDVDYNRLDAGNLVVEVGTSKKIIGESNRTGEGTNVAKRIRTMLLDSFANGTIGDNKLWSDITMLLDQKFASTFSGVKFEDYTNLLYKLLITDMGDRDPKTVYNYFQKESSSLSRAIGGLILYNYLHLHGDDVIMSINYGAKQKPGFDTYETRYMKVTGNPIQFIKFIVEKGWYNFELGTNATKFRLGDN